MHNKLLLLSTHPHVSTRGMGQIVIYRALHNRNNNNWYAPSMHRTNFMLQLNQSVLLATHSLRTLNLIPRFAEVHIWCRTFYLCITTTCIMFTIATMLRKVERKERKNNSWECQMHGEYKMMRKRRKKIALTTPHIHRRKNGDTYSIKLRNVVRLVYGGTAMHGNARQSS